MKRLLPIVLLACGVPAPPSDTGGANLGGAGACPRAFVVVSSDYFSSKVSLVSPVGEVLSESFLSSASVPVEPTSPGWKDVVVPHEPTEGEVVVIDRANAILTWADPASGKVTGQLSVREGLAANPHDYLRLSPSKAWVTRYDGTGDVVVIDPSARKITQHIDLAAEGGSALARPEIMTRLASGKVVLPLLRLSVDSQKGEDARLVGLDPATDAIVFRVDVPGVANCQGAALSPAKRSFALACTGVIGEGAGQLPRSGVVLFDVTGDAPREVSRFKLEAPPSAAITFASEDRIVGILFGDLSDPKNVRPDILYGLDIRSGAVERIATAGAFTLGAVVGGEDCERTCLVANASANASEKGLSVFGVPGMARRPSVPVDRTTGLPPRAIGALR